MTGSWWQYLGVFLASAALCLVLTPQAVRFALRFGFVDKPGGYKDHAVPLPYLGSLAIVASFAGSVVAAALIWQPVSGLDQLITTLSLGVGLAVVGLLDDLKQLSVAIRLIAEVAAAVVLWRVAAGVGLTDTDWIDLPLTILWVVGITNAFNLSDNMDGLAAGLAAIMCMTIFAIAVANGQHLVAGLAIGLVGCAIGFLRHNFHPASVFMGDAGSLFFGFMVATLGIRLRFDAPESQTFLVPIMICSIPIVDTTLVVVSRIRSGRSPFQGNRDHLSHRIVHLGLSVKAVTLLVYFLAGNIGVLSFVASRVDSTSAYIISGLIFSMLMVIAVILMGIDVYRDGGGERSTLGQRILPGDGLDGGS